MDEHLVSHENETTPRQISSKLGSAELIERSPAAAHNPKTNVRSSASRKALKFVKEWGGIATVLIAILYTFPFDAAGRFINWRQRNLVDARNALTDVAALYAAETSAIGATTDPQARSFLASTYQIRIYNELSKNKEAISRASNDLLSSELYMVGSLYTLSGLPEGLPYYKLALKKAITEAERATIYRELGNALFSDGPNHNIADARDAFVQALTLTSNIPYLKIAYSSYLTELAGFEMMFGDWKCGQDLNDYGMPLLDLAAAAPNASPAIRDSDKYLHGLIGTLARGPNQPNSGCPYRIPFLMGNSGNGAPNSTSAPPGTVGTQFPFAPPLPQAH